MNVQAAPYSYFQTCFEKLRQHHIPFVIHTGEVPNEKVMRSVWEGEPRTQANCNDTDDILNIIPDRLGHALFLSEKNQATVRDLKIPIEVCPSSNMKTMGLSSLETHPVICSLWKDCPTSINTDDTVIFNISLSDEYWKVARLFQWTREEAIDYVEQVCPQILDKSPSVESSIRTAIEKFKNSI